MSARKWIPADTQKAMECEREFQRGGPRVFTYEYSWSTPCYMSASRAVMFSRPGDVVCARRRYKGKYAWFVAASTLEQV